MQRYNPEPGRKRVRSPGETATAGSRAGLARDQLVHAALDLLREGGLPALSTRRLAERLGVKSPALYWHVRNKDELLGLVVDALCAGMALPAPGLPFRARIEAIAWEYRRVLLAWPDATRLFAELAPTGPHRMRLYDAAVGAFLDAGCAPSEAVALATFLRHYLLGMITEEARQCRSGDAGIPSPSKVLGAEISGTGPLADCPHLAGAAEVLRDIEPEALFGLGLDILLDGLERRLSLRRGPAGQA
ncbi:TetR/AcrR family transcriptional regulator C-terminal domain-containing protein [Frateuria sp. GZRR35]|uniref:TetR/AcrR family transcriptional regulator C-terminal domain-containing protein n=1 Tax=Frateuria sp. GZRR35 TaxID=3351536 RepID=UPI003EDBEA04